MNIIKRSGEEAPFEMNKILLAVKKANNTVAKREQLCRQEMMRLEKNLNKLLRSLNRSIKVEEIQDMVEKELMELGKFRLVKNYMIYRYKRELICKGNTTDQQILSLIGCVNEEAKQENSNKNPIVNSVQRDYTIWRILDDFPKIQRLLPSP